MQISNGFIVIGVIIFLFLAIYLGSRRSNYKLLDTENFQGDGIENCWWGWQRPRGWTYMYPTRWWWWY